MAPYPIGIGDLGPIIKQEGGRNMEFLLIFLHVLFFLLDRHFEKHKVGAFKQLLKFYKGRRLLPTFLSPGGVKIQDHHLAPQILKREFPTAQFLQGEIWGRDRSSELTHPRPICLGGKERDFP
jgi:hypothetical protein